MNLPKTQEELIILLSEIYMVGYERGYEASPYEPDEYTNPSFDDYIHDTFDKEAIEAFYKHVVKQSLL